MEFKLWDELESGFIALTEDVCKQLILKSGLDSEDSFVALGLQDGNQPIVLGESGRYGLLDPNRYRVIAQYPEDIDSLEQPAALWLKSAVDVLDDLEEQKLEPFIDIELNGRTFEFRLKPDDDLEQLLDVDNENQ
jgi:hypothetical protein